MSCCSKLCKGLTAAVPWGIGSAVAGSVLGAAARVSLGFKNVGIKVAVSSGAAAFLPGYILGFSLNIAQPERGGNVKDEAMALLPVYTLYSFGGNALLSLVAAHVVGDEISMEEAFKISAIETLYAIAIGVLVGNLKPFCEDLAARRKPKTA